METKDKVSLLASIIDEMSPMEKAKLGERVVTDYEEEQKRKVVQHPKHVHFDIVSDERRVEVKFEENLRNIVYNDDDDPGKLPNYVYIVHRHKRSSDGTLYIVPPEVVQYSERISKRLLRRKHFNDV